MKTQVCISWLQQGHDQIYFLARDGGRGLIRTYYKDRYDPRIQEAPFFDDGAAAFAWMSGHPRKQCQLQIRAAAKLADLSMKDFDKVEVI